MVIVLSGSSASGKNTLINELLKTEKDLKYIQTFTSRLMREGESEGNPYHFITKEEFQNKMIEDGAIHYGISKEDFINDSQKMQRVNNISAVYSKAKQVYDQEFEKAAKREKLPCTKMRNGSSR